MCRFALYLGDPIRLSQLVTEPEHSILKQSFQSREREEPLNGDGFGIAWYVPEMGRPAIFKEVRPAWNSLNLNHLARVTTSHCLLAHVRAATPGLPVEQLNCHPFYWGSLTFMHNGRVGGFPQIKRRIVAELSEEAYLGIRGSTDSEHLFALVWDAWRFSEVERPRDRLEDALRRGVAKVEALRRESGTEEPSLLNLALCDGERAVVSRYTSDPGESNTLYYHTDRHYVCEEGVSRMVSVPPEDDGPGAVIVASEPLTHDPDWQRVPLNHLVRVDRQRQLDVVPFDV